MGVLSILMIVCSMVGGSVCRLRPLLLSRIATVAAVLIDAEASAGQPVGALGWRIGQWLGWGLSGEGLQTRALTLPRVN